MQSTVLSAVHWVTVWVVLNTVGSRRRFKEHNCNLELSWIILLMICYKKLLYIYCRLRQVENCFFFIYFFLCFCEFGLLHAGKKGHCVSGLPAEETVRSHQMLATWSGTSWSQRAFGCSTSSARIQGPFFSVGLIPVHRNLSISPIKATLQMHPYW